MKPVPLEERPTVRAPIEDRETDRDAEHARLDDLLAGLTEALKEHGYTVRPVEPEESA